MCSQPYPDNYIKKTLMKGKRDKKMPSTYMRRIVNIIEIHAWARKIPNQLLHINVYPTTKNQYIV